MIAVDYHLHTRLCGHAAGEIQEYLERAAQKGLKEVGFSDHLPLYFLPPERAIPAYAMEEEELPVYIDMVNNCRGVSPVKVKLGIEADYAPGYETRLASLLNEYSFDYVIGSVHFIDGWGFDNPDEIEEYSRRDINQVYEQYFTLVQQAALTGLFDIMAHPDLVKKFNFRPGRDLTPLYEETAGVFKKAGVCVEVNTAGLRYPVKEIYPSPEMLGIFFKHGLPVTLGSDAHRPELVGADMEKALLLLKDIGYKEIAVFERRQRKYLKIFN